MTANLQAPAFTDNDTAREAIEALMWPNGPVCPHCGCMGKIGRIEGKSARPGLYYCGDCKKQFTVTVGTIFERSKVPLSKWWAAIHLMASSKKGMSAHQLHRMLGVTYQTAWFMEHRIREAMREGGFLPPMGGEGKVVEADETYYGPIAPENLPPTKADGKPRSHKKQGPGRKRAILSLVERGGSVRSFHIQAARMDNVTEIVRENIHRESRLQTDESNLYHRVGKEFAAHETVNHSEDEYARGDVTTNTVEGYFSIFKRGMSGIYQHCADKHLHRYLAEFDFRYNNRIALNVDDNERHARVVRGAKGKRLMYKISQEKPTAI